MKKIFSFIFAITILFSTWAFFIQHSASNVYASVEKIYSDKLYERGGTPSYVDDVRIDYAYKIEEEYVNPYGIPGYLSRYTCGVSAGGVAIGFYDRLYEELIPNHAGSTIWGKYFYGSHDAEVEIMYDSLYTKMNATSAGVTLNGYTNGVKSYTSSKGRITTFTSVMNGTQINASQYKTAIINGKLLTVFMDGFSIIDFGSFSTYNGYDKIYTYVNIGCHVMVAYGFLDVSYYNSSNQCFRKDTYLYVSSGYSIPMQCLVKLNQYCIIDECYITDVG